MFEIVIGDDVINYKFFAIGFVFLVLGYIVIRIIDMQRRKAEETMDKSRFVMHYAKFPIWVTGLFAFFLAGAVLVEAIFIRNVELVLFLITLLVALLFSSAFTYFAHWELSVVGNDIQYSTLFKAPKKYTFSEIKKVDAESDGTSRLQLKIYSDTKKLFIINSFCVGYDFFAERLCDENVQIVVKKQ